MGTLIIFNLILIAIIIALLSMIRNCDIIKRHEKLIFLLAPAITIVCHYSTLIYLLLTGQDTLSYVNSNPNLILPIYPCNIVMWCALIYGIIKDKNSKFGVLISDYLFWFGIASTLVGMFANVDFIMNPTLTDWEVTKSILAHATLLFNVLLIPVFGRLRPHFGRNMLNMCISVIAMYIIGLYCNLIFKVLISTEAAYNVNSMFIIHSPFEGAKFLRYPIIALASLIIYLIIFTVCDLINKPKGQRWSDSAFAFITKNKLK